MKKAKVYTRTGDKGQTALVSGTRVSKSDARIDLYGELDDLNARMGLISSVLDQTAEFKEIAKFFQELQSAVFDLGSNLACEPEKRLGYKLPQLSNSFITAIEKEIDRLDSELEALSHFILPGGVIGSSYAHLARTGARNVERKYLAFKEETGEAMPENGDVFLNRLSDYFFILGRYLNKKASVTEKLWVPRP